MGRETKGNPSKNGLWLTGLFLKKLKRNCPFFRTWAVPFFDLFIKSSIYVPSFPEYFHIKCMKNKSLC